MNVSLSWYAPAPELWQSDPAEQAGEQTMSPSRRADTGEPAGRCEFFQRVPWVIRRQPSRV
jgi:hypothetical protein